MFFLDKINWTPLETVIKQCNCELIKIMDFMYMYTTNYNTKQIHAYKHRDTRNYIFIDNNNQCYKFQGNYLPISLFEAVFKVIS